MARRTTRSTSGDRVGAWLDERGRREVTQLLFVAWDPIGISDNLVAWREYESYADEIARLVAAGATTAELARRLQAIAERQMELETGTELNVASTLERWIATSLHAWEEEGRQV